ncbi:MAG: hypothetical protein IH945_00780 [Armatimonadetes bacterium]|nr:hypothetical protein [Armatimonadota bacterium]
MQVAAAQATSTSENDREDGLRRIETRLQKISEIERTSLFVDFGALSVVPPDWPMAMGEEGMRLLAQSLRRQWGQLDGVQLFLRPRGPQTHPKLLKAQAAYQFLSGLSDSQLDTLLQGKLQSKDLDPASWFDLVVNMSGKTANAPQRLLAGLNSTKVGLAKDVYFEVMDPTSGRSMSRTVQREPEFGDPLEESAEVDWTPLKPAPAGDLDFGKGDLLTLKEVIGRASKQFGDLYYYDARLANTLFFVSGSYSSELFNRVLARHTALPKAQPLSQNYEVVVEQLNDMLRSRLFSSVAAEDEGVADGGRLLQGVQVPLSAIQGRFPVPYSVFRRNGFSDQDPVRVKYRFRIVADPGTVTVLKEDTFIVDGREHKRRLVMRDTAQLFIDMGK